VCRTVCNEFEDVKLTQQNTLLWGSAWRPKLPPSSMSLKE